MSFINKIEKLTGVSKDKIGVYMIYLEKAVERLPLIYKLQSDLNIKVEIIPAIEGKTMVINGHPNNSINGEIQANGTVGCTLSHIKTIQTALQSGKEYAIIFEDDCIVTKSTDEISNILDQVYQIFFTYNIKYDIFLLGALGYTSFIPSQLGVSSINKFDGSHAILINRKGMVEYIKSYYTLLSNNILDAADGLYNSLINKGIRIYGFTDAQLIFNQQRDETIFSHIAKDHLDLISTNIGLNHT